MKARIIESEPEQKFVPFKVELTVESPADARLLYHIADHNALDKLFKDKTDYWLEDFSDDVSKQIDGNLYSVIEGRMEKMGLSI